MTRSMHFTQVAIRDLEVTGERYYVKDDDVPQLAVCVSGAGRKSFELIKKFRGQARRMTLGKYPDLSVEGARREARRLLGELATGVNVFDRRQADRHELTFGELHQRYMDEHSKPHKRTWKDDEGFFKRYLTGWSNKPLSFITRAELQKRHRQISETAPIGANRMVAFVSQMFGFAMRCDLWTEANPATHVTRNRERSRDRFLKPDEMPAFLQAVEAESNEIARDYILLSLLLGARQGNMLAMRWDQIHLERAEWRIPETKNGEPQTVHLPARAVQILSERKAEAGKCPWVFPGDGKTGHLVEPKKAWARVLERAGIENLRMHDLRRTLGSWQAASGTSLAIIGKSLGHKSQQTTAIYARLDLDPVRVSVDAAVAAMLQAANPKTLQNKPLSDDDFVDQIS